MARRKLELFADIGKMATPNQLPAPKRKPQPRISKLDGKPPARPRGRHADTSPAQRETVTIPTQMRLGFRPAEYAALLGVSATHVWRGIKNGTIKMIDVNGVGIIPRSHAINEGIITKDDHV
jgi:hypothetical protein